MSVDGIILYGAPTFRSPPSSEPAFPRRHSIFRVWCGHPSDLDQDKVRPDAFGVKRCQNEIRSGRYQAIVVLDYSNPDLAKKFERDFGKLLQNFARAGGAVAFPSSEGLIISTLQNYFDVEWKFSDYYRTNWGPCLEDNEINIHRNFGNGTLSKSVIKGYSAKGCSFRVPKHERCFGVTEESTTSQPNRLFLSWLAGINPNKREKTITMSSLLCMTLGRG